MDYSQVELPWEFTMWFDPSDVCCRLGEKNYYFTVKNEEVKKEEVKHEETKSDKAKTEVETSDYHSETTSDCSSEDEVSAKQGAMALAKTNGHSTKGHSTGNSHKWGPEYYYMPKPRNLGLWVPHPGNVGFFIPGTGFQPLTIHYMDVGSTKAPAAKPRNPNLVKRLTRRATRK